jgi:hypothetical protein
LGKVVSQVAARVAVAAMMLFCNSAIRLRNLRKFFAAQLAMAIEVVAVRTLTPPTFRLLAA